MQDTVYVPSILVTDQTNELYVERTPLTWKGEVESKECKISDITDYRCVVGSMLDCLYYTDHQYRDQLKEASLHYSLCGICASNVFKRGVMVPVLNYRVMAVSDISKGTFHFVTDVTDQGFRPLFKDYELFIIELLVLHKQFYRYPFLLALQRTCYLWLLSILKNFELKGSTVMKVIWAETKPEKDYYYLYSAMVTLDFDLTQCYGHTFGVMTSVFDLVLGVPHFVTRKRIEKSDFDGDQDFHNHLWSLRIKTINDEIKNRNNSLYCNEDISDIK